ncbi:hypothetical protein A0U91_15445 (plasmid) [Acetobacter persici]|uniref:Uncharacterized protein n=2 Tax=Acetobacter persici TaxID=1076596 RepID=A0A1U9LJ24_9PROT|nr:hypothetical protein A0U91_15445 [Acetobacter persici]
MRLFINKAFTEKMYDFFLDFSEIITNIGLVTLSQKTTPNTGYEREHQEGAAMALMNIFQDTPRPIKDLPSAIRKATKAGIVDFSGHSGLTHLPDHFATPLSLDLCGCENLTSLPSDLYVGGWMDASGSSLTATPKGMTVRRDIILRGCDTLQSLPHHLCVDGSLDVTGCEALRDISGVRKVSGNLEMTGCISLQKLPDEIAVGCSINLSDCRSLTHLPSKITVGKSLTMRGCESLECLPDFLHIDGDLDLTDCTSLRRIPPKISVSGYLKLSGCTGIAIPQQLISSMYRKILLPIDFSVF